MHVGTWAVHQAAQVVAQYCSGTGHVIKITNEMRISMVVTLAELVKFVTVRVTVST